MKNIWILARMTFREAIRRRIVLTGLVLGLIFLTAFNIGFRLVFVNISDNVDASAALTNVINSEGMNMLALAGLYAVTFLSVAMGALLGADTLSGRNRLWHHPDHRQQARAPLGCGARQVAGIRHSVGVLFDADVWWDSAQRVDSIRGYTAECGGGAGADLS